MSRKRGKKHKAVVEAVPEDILAEGSGPFRRADIDAVSTVEDVVTTDDISTTHDVVTADDVVVMAARDQADRHDGGASGTESLGADEPDLGDLLVADEAADADADAEAARLALAGELDPELAASADPADSGDGDAGPGGSPGERAEGEGDGEGEGEGDEDDDASVVFPTSAASMDAVQLKHLVEALIFASDRPLTVQRLRQLSRVSDVRRLEQALADLGEDYRERGLVLQQVSGGYQFRTRTQFSAWVQQLIAGRPVRLSRAQLETLAIIAYRQPITRPEIDDIRGVDSSATLKLLIDRMLIRVLGKREEVGRPMLYGTTKEFLDFFSLGDLRELPTLREYSELTAESRKVMSDRLGVAADGMQDGAPEVDALDGRTADGGDDGDDGGDDDGSGGNGAAGPGGAGGSGALGGHVVGDLGASGGHAVSPGDDAGAASAADLADAVMALEDRPEPPTLDGDGAFDASAEVSSAGEGGGDGGLGGDRDARNAGALDAGSLDGSGTVPPMRAEPAAD